MGDEDEFFDCGRELGEDLVDLQRFAKVGEATFEVIAPGFLAVVAEVGGDVAVELLAVFGGKVKGLDLGLIPPNPP